METNFSKRDEEFLLLIDSDADTQLLKKFLLLMKRKFSSGVKELHGEILQMIMLKSYPTMIMIIQNLETSQLEHLEIISSALNMMIHETIKEKSSDISKLLRVLSMIPINVFEMMNQNDNIFKQLLKVPYRSLIMLSLFSRKSDKLYDMFLQYWILNVVGQDYVKIEILAYQMFKACGNVFEKLFECFSSDMFPFNPYLRNIMIVLKLQCELVKRHGNFISNCNTFELIKEFQIQNTPDNLHQLQAKHIAQLQTAAILLNFLKANNITTNVQIEEVIQPESILYLIAQYGLNASFESLQSMLGSICDIYEKNADFKKIYDMNLDLAKHYCLLTTTMDIVLEEPSNERNKEHDLFGLIRQVNDINQLANVMESVFNCLFLTREYNVSTLQNSKISKTRNTSEHSGNDSNTKLKQEFLCKESNFYNILTKVKNFALKKIHTADYKSSDLKAKQNFQKILKKYTETLWKFEILRKIRGKDKTNEMLTKRSLLNPEVEPFIIANGNGSDSQSNDEETISNRERPQYKKKKHWKRAKGCIEFKEKKCDDICNKIMEIEATDANIQIKRNSIVSKLFIVPEKLAEIALSSKNYIEAYEIIKHYNLTRSEVNEQLNYFNLHMEVKTKLTSIYSNYQLLEDRHPEPLATVDQIKSVAAKGFEVSKIISVIDQFARSNPIHQEPQTKTLLTHHIYSLYPFLKQYEEHNLNAILIGDLIIDMPFNREVISHIIMIIKKQQKICSDIARISRNNNNNHSEHVNLPSNMGTMIFLEMICECLRLLEQNQKRKNMPISICGILSNNFFSLKPNKLFIELDQKKAFEEVYFVNETEIETLQELKRVLNVVHMVPKVMDLCTQFIFYLEHIKKLYKLQHDSDLDMILNEILSVDPYILIRELVFVNNVPPVELESSVRLLNISLVHAIAINICPEVSNRGILIDAYNFGNETGVSIMNYVGRFSKLLSYLLSRICSLDVTNVGFDFNETILSDCLQVDAVQLFAKLGKMHVITAALKLDIICLDDVQTLQSKDAQLEYLLTVNGTNAYRQNKARILDEMLTEYINGDSTKITLARNIIDVAKRAEVIREFFYKMTSVQIAKDLIQLTLTNKKAITEIPKDLLNDLETFVQNIQIFDKVAKAIKLNSWIDACNFRFESPNHIFKALLDENMFELCYSWSQAISLPNHFRSEKHEILKSLLAVLVNMKDVDTLWSIDKHILKLMKLIPPNELSAFLDENKEDFRSVALLKFSIEFIEEHQTVPRNLQNFKVALEMLKALRIDERAAVFRLLKNPLLVIEELLMNAKFEVLSRILMPVRRFLKNEKAYECKFCANRKGNLYDIHEKGRKAKHRFQLDANENKDSAFMLLNFNLYQADHVITNECIDLLLRIYATKALEYNMFSSEASAEKFSVTSDAPSLDSLCDTFQMPKDVPAKEDWIRDEEASHCMSCRRTKFTMLMRRHHCRRCGRVVCYGCSMHRSKIPGRYADVEVRMCNDCHATLQANTEPDNHDSETNEMKNYAIRIKSNRRSTGVYKWALSGNITYDKFLREEFSYDHAPSVSLCLSILEYHEDQEKCVDLLLYHCRKLEKLIVPNPEVDFELVSKMINCLALSAKVRGAAADVETLLEHAEIITAVVQNGYDTLIPAGPFNENSFRCLADSLVQSEHWKLALEVHLKWGFPTPSVMIAHGLSCLSAGAYETAREKFSHCMAKLTSECFNAKLQRYIFSNSRIKCENGETNISKLHSIPVIKRNKRGPPILKEILNILMSMSVVKPQPETLHRASLLRSSNSSLVTLFSRRKEQYAAPPNEGALNIMTRLANLKKIKKGQYFEMGMGNMTVGENLEHNKDKLRQTRIYVECMHYALSYGSHVDILKLLMELNELGATLRYYLYQNLEPEIFIHNIFKIMLSSGQVPVLIEKMKEISDERLLIWKKTLLQTCRYLETKKLLNSLYQLQVLLKDLVRASMTCVKFYSLGCSTFRQLNDNAYLLHDAKTHLQTELEQTNWNCLNGGFDLSFGSRKKLVVKTQNRRASGSSAVDGFDFFMHMDAQNLNSHINTIENQLDVTKFLAKCEEEKSAKESGVTAELLRQMRHDKENNILPTLFNGHQDKIKICILLLYCGRNIEEGFGLTYRIIKEYKLSYMKVFLATAKYLAQNERLCEVGKLMSCIESNEGMTQKNLDEIAWIGINSATNTHESNVKQALENLTNRIQDTELRIKAHIFIGQLKSAYLLATKNERLTYIKKILQQAERTNQIHIKKLCEKKLNIESSEKVIL